MTPVRERLREVSPEARILSIEKEELERFVDERCLCEVCGQQEASLLGEPDYTAPGQVRPEGYVLVLGLELTFEAPGYEPQVLSPHEGPVACCQDCYLEALELFRDQVKSVPATNENASERAKVLQGIDDQVDDFAFRRAAS